MWKKEMGAPANSVKEVFDRQEKVQISRQIPEALPAWFGIPEAREEYIKNSAEQPFFAASEADRSIGFKCLKKRVAYDFNMS